MGMHEYECGKCGLRFGRHYTRAGAERSGQIHRDQEHGGANPIDQSILTYSGGQMPTAADWRLFLLLAVILLAGIVHQAVTG